MKTFLQLISILLLSIGVHAQCLYTDIGGGNSFSVGLQVDGSLWQWGDGVQVPMQVGNIADWKSISVSRDHALALKNDSTLWAKGQNAYGALGNGTTVNSSIFIPIDSTIKWRKVIAGRQHSFGIKADGTLWAWGWNQYGELGDGTTTQRNAPVPIGTDTNWLILAGGTAHTLAIKTDGTLWAWGYNASGAVGDGTNINRLVPTQIGVDTNWYALSAASQSMAIKTDGTLWGWGEGGYGQRGDGIYTNINVPTQVGLDTNWANVSCGLWHTLFIKTNNTIWSSGLNVFGQLGDNSTVDKSVPVKIGLDSNWNLISRGWGHSFGIKNDGSAWSWGWNGNGQLGDSSTINKQVPTVLFCEAILLPLKLKFFNAEKNGNSVIINWSSVDEQNNKQFSIQRSANGLNFETIAVQNSLANNGHTHSEQFYNYTDSNPKDGNNYYRLEQVDIDEKKSYSEVKLIVFTATDKLQIWPNPASSVLNLNFNNAQFLIKNMTGSIVLKGTTNKIQIGNLKKGLYFLEVWQKGNKIVTKFIKE